MNALTPADAAPLAAPLSTPERSGAHGLTLLRAIPQERWKRRRFEGWHTPVLTKRFHVQGNAVLATEYDNALLFDAERLSFGGVHDLHRLLLEIEGDPHACLIRGEAPHGADLRRIHRRKPESDGLFAEVPRHVLALDIDGTLPLPPSTSVLADPAGVVEMIRDHVGSFARELAGVTMAVQLSARAGLDELRDAEAAVAGETGVRRDWSKVVRDGVSAHLWLWLDEPQGEAALKRWIDRVKESGLGVDRAFVQTVQPLFTAAPRFEAPLRDPLLGRRTFLV
jgi:putative DNA primase/helicase